MSDFSPEKKDTLKLAQDISHRIIKELSTHIIGQEDLQKRLIQTLIADGHLLLEGVPGLGKTLAIKSLAQCIDATFKRIQFTPDLLPADLVGTEIYRQQTGEFQVRQGPVFANFVLADEINRAPAKVQSALLETMQEKQVTIGTQTLILPKPFFVLATQNPLEQEGTYPLPEAQLDRFLMKVKVNYPSVEAEEKMLDLVINKNFENPCRKVATLEDITFLKTSLDSIYVDVRIKKYIVNLINATRETTSGLGKFTGLIEYGVSPRATIALYQLAKAEALLNGEQFVVPQNVKDIAHDVMRHRLIISYEAEAQGLTHDDIISKVLDSVEVP